MPTAVVNLKHDEYDVYIGRANRYYHLEKSMWSNPYHIGRDGTRQEVIAKYERWIKSRPDFLLELPRLKGKRLGCWCAPLPCHGDVLVRLLAEQEGPNEE